MISPLDLLIRGMGVPLQKLRESKKISVEDLSRRLGIDFSLVEANEIGISKRQLDIFCETCSVNHDFILGYMTAYGVFK